MDLIRGIAPKTKEITSNNFLLNFKYNNSNEDIKRLWEIRKLLK